MRKVIARFVLGVVIAFALAIVFTGRPAMALAPGGGGGGGGGGTCHYCDCHVTYMGLRSCFCPTTSWGGIGCQMGHDSVGNRTCELYYGPCPAPASAFGW